MADAARRVMGVEGVAAFRTGDLAGAVLRAGTESVAAFLVSVSVFMAALLVFFYL